MYTLKKSLGQHFLKDETICRRIIAVLEEESFQKLLEVGPGGGALTKYLIRIPGIDFACNWWFLVFPSKKIWTK